MRQLTRDEAISFHDERKWEKMGLRERAFFQLEQDKLCMPFKKFHEAVEKTLGRSVFTHEFGMNRAGLMAELTNDSPRPSLDQIFAMIPVEKLIVIPMPSPAASGLDADARCSEQGEGT